MIITRTPFRISFAGGGSDLPVFYKRQTGCVLSTSIDKYMFIALHPYFDENKSLIKYSKTELVDKITDIKHPIVREVLLDLNLSGLDINSIADIPAGTGLSSSSAFTVGLLHALYAHQGKYVSKDFLAEQACKIEMEKLGEPIGKQDQYAAAFGGLNFINFYPDDTVHVEKLAIKPQVLRYLEQNLLMFYIGGQRETKSILSEQSKNIVSDSAKFNNLQKMTELAHELKKVLYSNQLDDFGRILHEGWLLKRELTSKISNDKIDYYYQIGIDSGALGGKLLGAGGNGFLLFYCQEYYQDQLRKKLADLKELPFLFDTVGTTIVHYG